MSLRLAVLFGICFCTSLFAEVEIEGTLNEETTAGWKVSPSDLINAGSPALSAVTGMGEGMRAAITDGEAGGALTADTQPAECMSYDNIDYSITYALNTERSPNGYDIQEIATYAGWSQWRVNQVYEVIFQTATAAREPIAKVNYAPVIGGIPKLADASTKVTIKNTDGSPLASGVTAITFIFSGDPENAQPDPLGAMYREVDVVGQPTP